MHILRILLPMALIGAAIGAATAHASSITYDLLNVSTSSGNLTGTVTVDAVFKDVTAANVQFVDPAAGNPFFNVIASASAYNGLSQDYISGPSTGSLNWGGQLTLFFDTANLGSGPLTICTATAICGTQGIETSQVSVYSTNGNGGPFVITTGSLALESVPAPTPEPPASILLGTGIVLFIVGAGRCRMLHRLLHPSPASL